MSKQVLMTRGSSAILDSLCLVHNYISAVKVGKSHSSQRYHAGAVKQSTSHLTISCHTNFIPTCTTGQQILKAAASQSGGVNAVILFNASVKILKGLRYTYFCDDIEIILNDMHTGCTVAPQI